MRHTFILARRANMTDDVCVSTEIQVDDETRAALLLFNERVEANAAKERGTKRVAKAQRAKDEAAAVVRKLAENPGASAEEKAEAETAYKAAVASLTETKDDPRHGMLSDRVNHLHADSAGRGLLRIPLILAESPKSGGLRHFDDRHRSIFGIGKHIAALDLTTESIHRRTADPPS